MAKKNEDETRPPQGDQENQNQTQEPPAQPPADEPAAPPTEEPRAEIPEAPPVEKQAARKPPVEKPQPSRPRPEPGEGDCRECAHYPENLHNSGRESEIWHKRTRAFTWRPCGEAPCQDKTFEARR